MLTAAELNAELDRFAAEAAAFPPDGAGAPDRFWAWFTDRFRRIALAAERPWGTVEAVARCEALFDAQWPRFVGPPGTVKRYPTVESLMAIGDEMRARVSAEAGRFATSDDMARWLDAELLAFRQDVPHHLADVMLAEIEATWRRACDVAEARGWMAPDLAAAHSMKPVRPGIG